MAATSVKYIQMGHLNGQSSSQHRISNEESGILYYFSECRKQGKDLFVSGRRRSIEKRYCCVGTFTSEGIQNAISNQIHRCDAFRSHSKILHFQRFLTACSVYRHSLTFKHACVWRSLLLRIFDRSNEIENNQNHQWFPNRCRTWGEFGSFTNQVEK